MGNSKTINFSRKNKRLTFQKQEKAGDLKNFRNKEKTGVICRGQVSGLFLRIGYPILEVNFKAYTRYQY